MLHFWPCDPIGQVVSVAPSIVHFCEHSGDVDMLNELVHTPLAHSVDVSETTVHIAPNGWFVSGAASGAGGGALPEHAARMAASTMRFIWL